MQYRLYVVLAFITFALPITTYGAENAPANKVPDIIGTYYCQGHDPFANIDYKGKMTIKKTGDTYNFKWDLGPTLQYEGTGFFNVGDKTSLAVTFWNIKNLKEFGIETYKIYGDGSLSGSWTLKGKQQISNEYCKKNTPQGSK